MTTIRYAVLLVPLIAVGLAAAVRRPDRRTAGAALFAFMTAAVGIAGVNAAAIPAGWWSYATVDATLDRVPVDLWLGWAAFWGALPVLAGWPVLPAIVFLGWLDLLAMPRLEPLVSLGPKWLIGEALGLAVAALPAMLVGRWMARRERLAARATLQLATVAGLVLWLVPTMAIAAGDGAWRHVWELPRWVLSLLVQLGALVAIPGVLAVREFVERGGGTPYPWDPPDRLVTTGPYAYVANPMQLSACGLFLLTAVATRSWSVAAATVFAVAFSAAVAGPHEDNQLTRRHGAAWSRYRASVRPWWPRWRPDPPPAQVYLAETCDLCSTVAVDLRRRQPISLRVCPAEWHVRQLRRARYEGHDGYAVDGVAAVARTLEHVNLGWALLGWCLRVPGVDTLVQVMVDALGGDPREIRRAYGGHPVEAARRGTADDS